MTTPEGGAASAAGAQPYSLDNAAQEAHDRMAALATLFDPGTMRQLAARGVTTGWRCAEIGAGGGSIAAFLCERVGPTGSVLATDVNPRFLAAVAYPNLTVQQHDIVHEELPHAAFDLVHARLVLEHLPGRAEALQHLVAALKPGGWLLLEDFDSAALLPDPEHYPGEELLKTQQALWQVMTAHGLDRRYGRRCPALLRAHGLVDIRAEGSVSLWTGGSPGADLVRTAYEQLQAELVGSGLVSQAELEHDLARLADPDFSMPSSVLWAAWGRRPLLPA
jgi:SAM-dependent methyltransferase